MARFYLTTAIDYVNNRPHLGTAYEKIAADVIARYRRMTGARRALRHGQRRAFPERVPPCPGTGPRAARILQPDGTGVSRRVAAAQHLVRRLHPDDRAASQAARSRRSCSGRSTAGDIYEGEYEGWYCVSCEAFKQEKDLVEGLCPIHRAKPDWIKERNYFFRLSAYRDRLLAHYRDRPGVRRAGVAAQRDAAAARGGARGHLRQPRRAGLGHSAAVRAGERRRTSGTTR